MSSNLKNPEADFGESLLAIVGYIPLLSILLGVGFLAIYLLASFGIFGSPAWQLLAVTGVVLLVAGSHLQIIRLVRQKRGRFAFGLYSITMAIAGILFVFFWQDALIVAILLGMDSPTHLDCPADAPAPFPACSPGCGHNDCRHNMAEWYCTVRTTFDWQPCRVYRSHPACRHRGPFHFYYDYFAVSCTTGLCKVD